MAPERVGSRKCSSENEDSEVCSSNVNSSEIGNHEDLNEEEVKEKAKRPRKCSETGSTIAINLERIRTRASSQSQGSKEHPETANNSEIKDEKEEEAARKESMELENALGGLTIMEDQEILPHSLMMKKESSNFSRGE